MFKKIFFRIAALCMLMVIMCTIAACGPKSKIKKITATYGAGSSFCVMSSLGAPYSVKGVTTSSTGRFIKLSGYVRSRDGTPYDVLNSDGKRISTINLIPREEAYAGASLDVDVLSSDLLIIEKDTSRVRLWTSERVPTRFTVLVEERDTPLLITLDNITIDTQQRIPFLINPNNCDITFDVTGHCQITAGSQNMTENEYQQYLQALDEIKTLAHTWSQLKNPNRSAIVLCYSFLQCCCETMSTNSGSFSDAFISFTDKMCNELQKSIDALHDLYYGANGADGLDGVPTIMSLGGIEITGAGTLYIKGGNGENGLGGSAALGFGGNGGNGGDSGYAVFAQTVIDTWEDAIFVGGDVGLGGEGGSGLGAGTNGIDGEQLDAVKAIHFLVP